MKIFGDYHTHTVFSDGKSAFEENVIAAKNKGLKEIGISDHGFSHMGFGISYENFEKSIEIKNKMQEKYPEIKIFLSLEANILDDEGNLDVSDEILSKIDYLLAGYHFGSRPRSAKGVKNHLFNFVSPLKKYEISYNTRALVNAMIKNKIHVLTHPGDKGDVDINEVAKTAEETGTILEINEHHKNLTYEQLLITKNYNIKYILSSDAHHFSRVGEVSGALDRAIKAKIDLKSVVNLELE